MRASLAVGTSPSYGQDSGETEGAVRHVAEHVVHLRVGQPTAVRRGVEQPEQHVGPGPRSLGAQRRVVEAYLGGPHVDVGALQGPHPLASLVGKAAPVAVLD